MGGSSWLDALLLAPGLHYQQAADALVGDWGAYEAVELVGGKTAIYNISNPATLNYLRRVSRPGEIVTVDVGALPSRRSWRRRQRQKNTGQRARIWADQTTDFGWLSHLLYLASPALTVAAVVFMVLVQDCKYYFSNSTGSYRFQRISNPSSHWKVFKADRTRLPLCRVAVPSAV